MDFLIISLRYCFLQVKASSKYSTKWEESFSVLLEEYFNIRLSDEALPCVMKLKNATYYPEFVKEAIYLGLGRSAPCVELVAKLLEYLLDKEILTPGDIRSGCLRDPVVLFIRLVFQSFFIVLTE